MKQAAEELSRLPVPDEDAQLHSEQLITLIHDEIKSAGGQISFARYMELALYAPGLGYYSAGSRKFGESGDFVTAPEISSLFSQALARQVGEVLKSLTERGFEKSDVLEVGGGSGIMAADMLAELERLQNLPNHYPVCCFSVERGIEENGIKERYVTWQEDRFQWMNAEPESAELKEQLERAAKDLPMGYQSEINLAANAWVQSIAETLESGVVLLLDYGFPRHEYYHPERSAGTLMCHYRHRAHDDPFVYPGLQDITAHVDFTAIAEAAQASGLNVSGYTSQAYFLLSNGLTEIAEANAGNERDQLLYAQQIRTLTMPGEMGELFKVMALTKNYESALTGFSMLDARHKL